MSSGILEKLGNDRLFGKDFTGLSFDKFKDYLEHYNIKWVFAYSGNSKEYFDRFPEYLKKVNKIDVCNM